MSWKDQQPTQDIQYEVRDGPSYFSGVGGGRGWTIFLGLKCFSHLKVVHDFSGGPYFKNNNNDSRKHLHEFF